MYLPVTVAPEILAQEGYVKVAAQTAIAVLLQTPVGWYDLFVIRDSYAGWHIKADDGRVLEYCATISEETAQTLPWVKGTTNGR